MVRARSPAAHRLPSQPLQHQLAHAFPRAVHRLAEQLCPQRTQNALRQQQQRHRTDAPFCTPAASPAADRKEGSSPPKVSTKAPAQPNLPRLKIPLPPVLPAHKFQSAASLEKVRHRPLFRRRCRKWLPQRSPPASAHSSTASAASSLPREMPPKVTLLKRYNQHRGGQHHADKICPCQGEQTLSQRKRLESPRQKIGTGGCHCRLRQKAITSLYPEKGLCQQRCHRRQQQSKMPAAAPLLSAAWSIRCVLRCGAPG